ncbi:unnamed protein product [Cuscuta europaea]|uniref:Uncharacterized protein n=1 Tax=Cuscuta europaea TaxID=41803 RepID=A0A9P0ZUI3_CUSEU|nr:unnamed protein product [Cuscuta europaea]
MAMSSTASFSASTTAAPSSSAAPAIVMLSSSSTPVFTMATSSVMTHSTSGVGGVQASLFPSSMLTGSSTIGFGTWETPVFTWTLYAPTLQPISSTASSLPLIQLVPPSDTLASATSIPQIVVPTLSGSPGLTFPRSCWE